MHVRGADEPLNPWTVAESDYPAAAGMQEKLRFLLRYAILAPSSHNTQPWRFRMRDDHVELLADRTRRLPVVDPDDRALVISCGAALATLRIAGSRFRHNVTFEVLPDPDDLDLLARVWLEHGEPVDDDEENLFRAIPQRHSNRKPFSDRDLPADLLDALVSDAGSEGVSMCLIGGDRRAAVAALIAEGDRIQMADRRFRRELASWIHPNRSRAGDGMRGYGFGFGDLMSRGGPMVIRMFDLGKNQAAKDRALAEGSPLLSVFVTESDTPAAWLAAGQALQRALLRARAAGVWSSFLNPPIEVPDLRPKLAETIGRPHDHPQLVVRFGYGHEVRPQPRRVLEEAIEGGGAVMS